MRLSTGLPRVAVLLLCILASGLTGCTGTPDPGGTTSATPPQAKPFRITINSWAGFAPLFLARDKGMFQKNGLSNVEIILLEDAAARKSAMVAGRIEGYASSVDNFAIDAPQGVTGKIVMAFDESHGGDGIVAKPSIKTVADLKGKTVAVQPGLPGQFLLFHVMREAKLTPKDIKIVEMDSDKAGSAFVAGKVDAAVTWEPWLSNAKKGGRGHVLVSTADYPGMIVDVLAVPDEVLKERRADVTAVAKTWFDALTYAKDHKDESNTIMAKALKLPEADFVGMCGGIRFCDLKRNKEYFGSMQTPGPIFGVFESAGAIWAENKIVTTPMAPNQAIDASVLNEL